MRIMMYSDWGTELPPYGGGGEVYAINLLRELIKDHDVVFYTNVAWRKEASFNDVLKYYNFSANEISKVKVKKAPTIGWKTPKRFVKELFTHWYLGLFVDKFDLFINCSDSTLHGFCSKKRKTPSLKVIHFPWAKYTPKFKNRVLFNLGEKYKEAFNYSYDWFLPNSDFTKFWSQKILGINNAITLYPPINKTVIQKEQIKSKTDIILYTGRIIEEKKCFELVKAFKEISKEYPGWQMVVAGNFKKGDEDYRDKVMQEMKDSNCVMKLDLKETELVELYQKSKIFWSAKGLNEDEPLSQEHFGMTTVEAMANGCIPVVINKGGQREIVNNSCGRKFNTLDEMIASTIEIIKNKQLQKTLSLAAIEQSQKFLIDEFMVRFNEVLKKI